MGAAAGEGTPSKKAKKKKNKSARKKTAEEQPAAEAAAAEQADMGEASPEPVWEPASSPVPDEAPVLKEATMQDWKLGTPVLVSIQTSRCWKHGCCPCISYTWSLHLSWISAVACRGMVIAQPRG